MTSKGGVIGLNIELEVVLQAIRVQETNDSLRIIIILVGSGFSGLWFDEQLIIGTNLFLVVDGHLQECCHVINLIANLRIQWGHVTLTAAPENMVLPIKFFRDL